MGEGLEEGTKERDSLPSIHLLLQALTFIIVYVDWYIRAVVYEDIFFVKLNMNVEILSFLKEPVINDCYGDAGYCSNRTSIREDEIAPNWDIQLQFQFNILA